MTLLSEIPAGAFADTYGRKLSALIGALALSVAPFIVYFGGDFRAYIVTAVVAGIGAAFTSGSLESLVYDLPEMTKETYRKIMLQDTMFFQSGLIFSSAIGGFMYVFNSILPFVAQTASFLLAALLIAQMSSDGRLSKEEPSGADLSQYRQRVVKYLKDTKQGFLHLFAVKDTRPLIVFGASITVLMWMGIEYINEAAMIHYEIQPDTRGLLLAGAKLLALFILHTIVFKRVRTDEGKLKYLLFMTVMVFSLFSVGIKSVFLIAFLGFNLISSVQSNFIRPMLHDQINPRWRATAISSYSFVCNLAQAAVAIAVGMLLQSQGVVFVQRALLLGFLLMALPALLVYLPRLKSNGRIKI